MSSDDKDMFPKKWAKFLPDTFKDTVETKNNDELESDIYKAESSIADIEKDMDNDAKLKVLKEDLKIVMGSYRDSIKTEQAKIRWMLHVMRLRGAR